MAQEARRRARQALRARPRSSKHADQNARPRRPRLEPRGQCGRTPEMGLLPGRARARPDRRRRGSEGRPIQERSRRIGVSGRPSRERDGSLPRRRHRKRSRKDARSVRSAHGQSQGVGRRRAYVREGRVAFARVRIDDDALRGLRRAVRATRKRETRQAARRRRAARGRAQAERRRGEGEVREDVF